MSINPPSDLVLDVLKAADPERARAVADRLNSLSAASPGDGEDFAKVLQNSAAAAPLPYARAPLNEGVRATVAKYGHDDSKMGKVETDFEATILGSFVKELLPKDAQDVFGTGTSGEIWKSMLGDQIARQIAKSGELGISKRLFQTHSYDEHRRSAAMSSDVQHGSRETAAQASVNQLSLPDNVIPRDGAVLFADRKNS